MSITSRSVPVFKGVSSLLALKIVGSTADSSRRGALKAPRQAKVGSAHKLMSVCTRKIDSPRVKPVGRFIWQAGDDCDPHTHCDSHTDFVWLWLCLSQFGYHSNKWWWACHYQLRPQVCLFLTIHHPLCDHWQWYYTCLSCPQLIGVEWYAHFVEPSLLRCTFMVITNKSSKYVNKPHISF